LYLLLLSDSVQNYVQLNALGSAQKGIRMADLKVCPCVVPSEKALGLFNEVAGSVIQAVQNCWKESDALAELRDALLPKLMSGELDVDDVEV
jgi:type I restriction enzyme S subunit